MPDQPELLPSPPPRRRGAPSGNHNALKHGFYSPSFTASDKNDLETHIFIGLQEEIATLRLVYRCAVTQALNAEDPTVFQNAARVVIGLAAVLNATLRTQIELDRHGGSEVDAELQAALRDVEKELGLTPPDDDTHAALERPING